MPSYRFHGVFLQKRTRKWGVRIWDEDKGDKGAFRYFCIYDDEEDAARRYNVEAKKLNFPADKLNVIDDADGSGDDVDDVGGSGASMRSAATPADNAARTSTAATAARAATAVPVAPEAPAAAPPQQSVPTRSQQSEFELKFAAMQARIQALEAKAALEDAKAALAAARVSQLPSA